MQFYFGRISSSFKICVFKLEQLHFYTKKKFLQLLSELVPCWELCQSFWLIVCFVTLIEQWEGIDIPLPWGGGIKSTFFFWYVLGRAGNVLCFQILEIF